MKYYWCKICEKRAKEARLIGKKKEIFSGSRFEVRKHLREEHMLKKKNMITLKDKRMLSDKTINTGVGEFK